MKQNGLLGILKKPIPVVRPETFNVLTSAAFSSLLSISRPAHFCAFLGCPLRFLSLFSPLPLASCFLPPLSLASPLSLFLLSTPSLLHLVIVFLPTSPFPPSCSHVLSPCLSFSSLSSFLSTPILNEDTVGHITRVPSPSCLKPFARPFPVLSLTLHLERGHFVPQGYPASLREKCSPFIFKWLTTPPPTTIL